MPRVVLVPGPPRPQAVFSKIHNRPQLRHVFSRFGPVSLFLCTSLDDAVVRVPTTMEIAGLGWGGAPMALAAAGAGGEGGGRRRGHGAPA